MTAPGGPSGGVGATGAAAGGWPWDGGPLTLYLVKRLEMVTRALLDDALRPSGMTTLQFTALSVLERAGDGEGGMSSAELARRSFVTPQTMHEMVVSLERRELVSRRRDEANRRVLLLTLTDAGREALAAASPAVAQFEGAVLDAIAPERRAGFRDDLGRAYAALAGLAEARGGPAGGE